jgi:ankyrin repeat protein
MAMALTLSSRRDKHGFIERGCREPLAAFAPDAGGPGLLALRYALIRGEAAAAEALIIGGIDLATLDTEGASLLHDAALGDHVGIVRALLARGLDPNQASALGVTPLCEAVWACRVEALQVLLAAGAAPHVEPTRDDAPILCAARRGQADVLRILIDAGAPLNVRTTVTGPGGATPLHLACRDGHGAAVDVLLAAGADVHARDTGGRQPLHEGVHNPAIVRALIAHGADPHDAGTERQPVFAPITTAGPEATRVLLEAGARIDVVGPNGWTVAGNAASSGDLALLQHVVALGAPTGAGGPGGASPLWMAAYSGRAQIVAWLIEQGLGDANDRAVRQYAASEVSALMASAAAGSLDTVEVLLAHGADVHARDSIGRTALFSAVERGYPAIVDRFLAAGADLEAADTWGCTALHVAASNAGWTAVSRIEHLLERGADPLARDKMGRTPLDIALAGQVPSDENERVMVRPASRARDPYYVAVKVLLAAVRARGVSAAREAELKALAMEHRPPDVVAELF